MSADINSVRASVKSWEREFEAQRGRKPTSTDAKAEKDVWRSYQQYKALKRQSSASQMSPKKLSPTKRNSLKNSPSKRHITKPHNTSSPSKPRKHALIRTPTKPKGVSIELDSDTEEDEDQTPSKMAITEVFPTPQLRGRASGLFDLELPTTPSKSQKTTDKGTPSRTENSQRSPSKTPIRPELLETPQSKKTPDYFSQRVNSFPTAADTGESPLIKHKRARKSVSEIVRESIFSEPISDAPVLAHPEQTTQVDQVKEVEMSTGIQIQTESIAENLPEVNTATSSLSLDNSDESDEDQENDDVPTTSFSEQPDDEKSNETSKEQPDVSNMADLDESREYTYDGNPDNGVALSVPEFERRRKPKRQTRRVIMRPVGEEKQVATSKATDNFVRLKINKKKPFKRR